MLQSLKETTTSAMFCPKLKLIITLSLNPTEQESFHSLEGQIEHWWKSARSLLVKLPKTQVLKLLETSKTCWYKKWLVLFEVF